MSNFSRRSFLSRTTKATLAIGIGSSAMGSALMACSTGPQKDTVLDNLRTGFTQTDLPYGFAALEPHIDAKTMEIHYTKHAKSYADKLQEAAEEEDVDTGKPLEEVMMNISRYSDKMRNNGGGHYNHELFWKIMSPDGGGQPQGDLAQAINDSFGSYDEFVSKFEEEAKDRFGSGWAWLVLDRDKNLAVGSTPNQDNPLMNDVDFQGIPLMGIDVWEHAYYLKYQNERGEYISNWWNVVDWAKISERYERLKG
ncbi:superoxide dismutase [Litoribacter ruber]|uniref:superoxide dismutase n=1 Tax=Litoribacter ruber TaxID=702568 RepID=UPI001FE5A94F|nr:superoxide dismutase [Litoribacter ruber]